MEKQKWTKWQDAKGIQRRWRIVCDNCYRRRYCQFVLTTDNCILFRPSDAKRAEDYHNEYINAN